MVQCIRRDKGANQPMSTHQGAKSASIYNTRRASVRAGMLRATKVLLKFCSPSLVRTSVDGPGSRIEQDEHPLAQQKGYKLTLSNAVALQSCCGQQSVRSFSGTVEFVKMQHARGHAACRARGGLKAAPRLARGLAAGGSSIALVVQRHLVIGQHYDDIPAT